ncbi:unnamed protein product [Porites lobata]|uniref:Uncharacterized protein n=1 Tax=Porites lobata TaxID=104759 RepID=A0ABN8PTM4_9CNID|nr:unnamed protein product [Porites lobata]
MMRITIHQTRWMIRCDHHYSLEDSFLRRDDTDSPNTLNDLVKCYILTLASIIHRQAPLLTKKFTVRPLVTWFNNDIKKPRRERRQTEIRWRRTRSAPDLKGNLKKGRITQSI